MDACLEGSALSRDLHLAVVKLTRRYSRCMLRSESGRDGSQCLSMRLVDEHRMHLLTGSTCLVRRLLVGEDPS